MGALSSSDLVLAHLGSVDDPGDRTTPAICSAFDIGTGLSDRVEVLSALSSLQERGYLVDEPEPTGDRIVYSLTDEGETAAADRTSALASRTVTVVDDGAETLSLSTARDVLDAPSIAAVQWRASGGAIRLDDVPDDTFVGRDGELTAIEDALDRVTDGGAGTVTVVGERGVGKTELLHRATDRAETTGAAVASITCRTDPTDPYESIREALEPHDEADVFDRSDAPLDSAGTLGARRTELFEDLTDRFASIGGDDPLLVAVDDLHAAGDAVVEFLEFFADHCPDRTLLVATSRPADARADLTGIADCDPGTGSKEQSTDDPATHTNDSSPGPAEAETGDDEPATGTADVETGDDEPVAETADVETGDDEPLAETADVETGDDEPLAETTDGETGDDEPLAETADGETGDDRPPAESRAPSTNAADPPAESRAPSTNADDPPVETEQAPIERLRGGTPIEVDLELGPLNRADTRELVVRTVGDRTVPESLTDRFHERTGGTPLFVVELVAQLEATGEIDADARVYPDPDAALPTPEDVLGAVEDRLEALDDTGRSVLEDAAVLGHTIDPGILEAASDQPPTIVREYVDLSIETGLLEESGPIQFRSEVVREVLLVGIDPERKRDRHERFADAYLELSDPPPHAAVARHYERAGRPERALEQYCRAGEQAIEIYAHEASLDRYQRALSLARDLDLPDSVVRIVESIGRVHFLAGEYDDADRYFEYLRDRTDDPERVQRGYRYQAEMANQRGNVDRADEFARAGIEAVEEPNRTSCRLIGHRGWYRFQAGDLAAAEEYFRRQHDLARELDDEDRLAGAYHNLGTVAQRDGEVDRAIGLLERAAAANDRSGSDRDALASYNNLAIVYRVDGRIDDALATLETIQERAAEISDHIGISLAMANRSYYEYLRSNLDRADRLADDALEAARSTGLADQEGIALLSKGLVRTDRCRFDAARDRLESAIRIFESADSARLGAIAHNSLARLDSYEGRYRSAREAADAAIDRSESFAVGATSFAHSLRGDTYIAEGALDDAIAAYERALTAGEDAGNRQRIAGARVRLAVARAEHTGGTEGLDLARTGVETADRVDDPTLQSRACTGLARCLRIAGEYADAADALDEAGSRIDGADVPLYDCRLRVERARLVAARGDRGADRLLERTAESVADRGVALLAGQCRRALDD